jgi:hypothetical protein
LPGYRTTTSVPPPRVAAPQLPAEPALRFLPRLVAFTLAAGNLAVNLGLLTRPFGPFAIDLGFKPLDLGAGAVERLAHSRKRLVASPKRITRRRTLPAERALLALVGELIASVRESFAFTRTPIAFVRESFAFIGELFALVGDPISLIRPMRSVVQTASVLLGVVGAWHLIGVGGQVPTVSRIPACRRSVVHRSSMSPRGAFSDSYFSSLARG